MRWKAILPVLVILLSSGVVAPQAKAVAAPQLGFEVIQSGLDTPYLGFDLRFQWRVENFSGLTLETSITAVIPRGLTIVGADPPHCAPPRPCSVGALSPGGFVRLEVRVRVDAVINATVSGSVTGCTAVGPCFTSTGSTEVRTFPAAMALTIAVTPQPGLVGQPVTVTYTIRNVHNDSMLETSLVPGLPAGWTSTSGCAAPPQPCAVGTIGPSRAVSRTYTRSHGTPGTTSVSASVTATFDVCGDGCMRTITVPAVSQVVVIPAPPSPTPSPPAVIPTPVLTVTPAIGPPGFVTTAVGTGFPDGALVKLTWTEPVTNRPLLTETLTVTAANGGFTTQVLVFRRDQLGERTLVAEWVSGPQFNPASAPFLVVPNTWTPPLPIRD